MLQPLKQLGLSLTPESLPVVSENFLFQWELTKTGAGVGIMMDTIGDKEPLVERALQDSDGFVFPIWLVAHRQLKSSQRIRVVFDFLADSLAELKNNGNSAKSEDEH